MAASKLRSVTMSRTWGTFSRMTGSSVSRAAAIAGRAAFLAPLTRMVPTNGLPPRITSLSIDRDPGESGADWNPGSRLFILRGLRLAVAGLHASCSISNFKRRRGSATGSDRPSGRTRRREHGGSFARSWPRVESGFPAARIQAGRTRTQRRSFFSASRTPSVATNSRSPGNRSTACPW